MPNERLSEIDNFSLIINYGCSEKIYVNNVNSGKTTRPFKYQKVEGTLYELAQIDLQNSSCQF